MNIQERKEQCKADIKKLEEELKRLEKEEYDSLDENAPIFSKVSARLIIKLTKDVIEGFNLAVKNGSKYVSFCSYGAFGSYMLGDTWDKVRNYYSEIPEPIFKE